MRLTVDSRQKVRNWPHPERFQNTTLRYTPNADFPAVLAKTIGKPKIIRLFVTLDEVWDNRDDSYHWDYRIGVNRFKDDATHAAYDWPKTVPSPLGVHVQEYLISHANFADEVLLNVRRYEREVTDGLITIGKYEEVVKNVIRYYKEKISNIVYIECCNEVELAEFGGLEISQYYHLYKTMSKVVEELNQENNYQQPLKIGGFGMSGGIDNWKFWNEFLMLLSSDQNRKIDFYSMHEYHTDPRRIVEFYLRHELRVAELKLPKLPLFMTEYGLRVGIGDAGRPNNLQNSSGEVQGIILSTYCPRMSLFPWCTFHNPNQQLGRTMFIQDNKGQYLPTPKAHVMTMFHNLGEYEILISEYQNNQAVATIDNDGKIAILISNPDGMEKQIDLVIKINPNKKYSFINYTVNEHSNNCLTDSSANKLLPTHDFELKTNDNELVYKAVMEPQSITFVVATEK